MELRTSTRSQGGHIIVTLAGEIDLYTAPRLQAELAGALGGDGPVSIVVDMSAVDFCDSTGMNVLLAAYRQASERGGTLSLAAPKASVRKIFEVTGLDSVFAIHNDLSELDGN